MLHPPVIKKQNIITKKAIISLWTSDSGVFRIYDIFEDRTYYKKLNVKRVRVDRTNIYTNDNTEKVRWNKQNRSQSRAYNFFVDYNGIYIKEMVVRI